MSASLNTMVRERERNADNARSLERELASIKSSVSFRVGRAITWLPRKVRGGVRCYKEHGPAYTAHRFLEHLTGKAQRP